MLNHFMTENPLQHEQSYYLFSQLPNADLNRQVAILKAFNQKSSEEELLGVLDALIAHSVPISYSDEVIDIVGTGGDGLKTFNISTASSLVVASCGVTVAKHGGRSVSSPTGSADVLSMLNIPIPKTPDACIMELKNQGFAFLWAPLFNSLLSQLGKARQHLGAPSILNMLGPLVNPVRPKRQLVGVAACFDLTTVTKLLKLRAGNHAWVVQSDDGLDELSISAPSTVLELQHGQIAPYRIYPEELGLKYAPLQEVMGGNSTENAQIIQDLFLGKISGPKLDIVLLNSAAGLFIAKKVDSLKEGVECARFAITSGRVANFLYHLQQRSQT